MFYLYIKTHNKTGLKYLGKTIQDPHKYKGSGKRWKNHIKKHGNDVTTKIVGVFETIEDLIKFSVPLSEELNIVDSSEWANIRIESGDGGDTSQHIDYSKLNRGKGQTYEQRYGPEKAAELKQIRSETFAQRKGKTWEEIYGKERAKELRSELSIRTKLSNSNRIVSSETKDKIRKKAIGRKQPRCSCVYCNREISINNLSNHFKTHLQN